MSRHARRDRRRAVVRRRNRKWVIDYLLVHPCVDCGETDLVVLDFDHVRGKKTKCVSKMINDAVSMKDLKEEVSKCEIRCANCHRRVTARRGKWVKLKYLAS